METLTILQLFFFSTSFFITSKAIDTISANESISDGQTIVSASSTFELGFFSPGKSKNRYLGIRFKDIGQGTVAWVANRETPLKDSSGVLKLNENGVLTLLNQENSTIWSSNITSGRVVKNPVAQLLDSGNFVIRDKNDLDPENFLWQSFQHPDKTFLPGMKVGKLGPGLEVYISSWKSADDPSKGNLAAVVDSSGLQIAVTKDSATTARSGPWNGIGFSGMPHIRPNPVFSYNFVYRKDVHYYTFDVVNRSVYTMLVLSPNDIMERYAWINRTSSWGIYSSSPADNCDSYKLCGPHGSCSLGNSPVCSCLDRFVPKHVNDWKAADWSGGCVRRNPLDCVKGDVFIKYSNVKLPQMLNYSLVNTSITLNDCKMMCLKNCSCMGYATLDIVSGSGCFLWYGDLVDIKQYNEDGGGQDLYIRMASSELARSSNRTRLVMIVAGAISVAGVLLIALLLSLFICRKKRKIQQNSQGKKEKNPEKDYSVDTPEEDLELPHFDFFTITNATNNFSINNLLGEGGFGPVYKGMLKDEQEVAVKRLSRDSTQGLVEFKNEVKCIAKLQHRNLVKLLGYCIHLEEKMLIYEYMPNKSLDFYIFDETRSKQLDWTMRFNIINGISRGLLYLHQDSRLRIIHRDLKLSNILLDKEMNPKISDFGMARSFGGNETEANTRKVVGTYGYMPPEYAIDGIFSVKSDVFSFGVLVLEIINGKRNRGFIHPDHQHNLLGHAWKLFKENKYYDLIDTYLIESCDLSEVLRSIHVGLLCVQHCPKDRPTMSTVVLMLSGEGALPEPNEPGFFTGRKLMDERNLVETEASSGNYESCSVNEVTITMIDVR